MGWDQGFPNSGKGGGKFPSVRGESDILLGEGIFLTGEANLRRSDFDDFNLLTILTFARNKQGLDSLQI